MKYARLLNWFLLFCTVSYIACVSVYTIYVIQDFPGRRWFNLGFALIFSPALYAFLVTLVTEPGYLPRLSELKRISKSPRLREEKKANLNAIDELYWTYYNDIDADEENKDIMPGYCMYVHENTPVAVGFRECKDCRLLRPTIDTSHCNMCDRCVLSRDHHCVFMGTCIGERNRRQFVLMLASMTVLGITCASIITVPIISAIHRIPIDHIKPTIASIETGMVIVFMLLIIFKFFIFPRYFSIKTNLKILYLIAFYGLGMISYMTSVGHVELIPGLIWYSIVASLLFVVSSLVHQVHVIKEGMTRTQLARIEDRQEEADELKRQLLKRQSTDSFGANIYHARSWPQVVSYVLSGFVPSPVPSVSLS